MLAATFAAIHIITLGLSNGKMNWKYVFVPLTINARSNKKVRTTLCWRTRSVDGRKVYSSLVVVVSSKNFDFPNSVMASVPPSTDI